MTYIYTHTYTHTYTHIYLQRRNTHTHIITYIHIPEASHTLVMTIVDASTWGIWMECAMLFLKAVACMESSFGFRV